jgi:hypothetical protein
VPFAYPKSTSSASFFVWNLTDCNPLSRNRPVLQFLCSSTTGVCQVARLPAVHLPLAQLDDPAE